MSASLPYSLAILRVPPLTPYLSFARFGGGEEGEIYPDSHPMVSLVLNDLSVDGDDVSRDPWGCSLSLQRSRVKRKPPRRYLNCENVAVWRFTLRTCLQCIAFLVVILNRPSQHQQY